MATDEFKRMILRQVKDKLTVNSRVCGNYLNAGPVDVWITSDTRLLVTWVGGPKSVLIADPDCIRKTAEIVDEIVKSLVNYAPYMPDTSI